MELKLPDYLCCKIFYLCFYVEFCFNGTGRVLPFLADILQEQKVDTRFFYSSTVQTSETKFSFLCEDQKSPESDKDWSLLSVRC